MLGLTDMTVQPLTTFCIGNFHPRVAAIVLSVTTDQPSDVVLPHQCVTISPMQIVYLYDWLLIEWNQRGFSMAFRKNFPFAEADSAAYRRCSQLHGLKLQRWSED